MSSGFRTRDMRTPAAAERRRGFRTRDLRTPAAVERRSLAQALRKLELLRYHEVGSHPVCLTTSNMSNMSNMSRPLRIEVWCPTIFLHFDRFSSFVHTYASHLLSLAHDTQVGPICAGQFSYKQTYVLDFPNHTGRVWS
eukprot:439223-Pelagomonas_calceolata.AAC.1